MGAGFDPKLWIFLIPQSRFFFWHTSCTIALHGMKGPTVEYSKEFRYTYGYLRKTMFFGLCCPVGCGLVPFGSWLARRILGRPPGALGGLLIPCKQKYFFLFLFEAASQWRRGEIRSASKLQCFVHNIATCQAERLSFLHRRGVL